MKSSRLLGRLALRFFFQPLARCRQSRLPDQDVIISTSGCKMKIFAPRSNLIGRELYLRGVSEPEVTGAIRALTGPGRTIFDIGGDAGYHTLLFAHAVGPSGKVFVFEPIPAAQKRIEENHRLNGFEQCQIHGLALGRKKAFMLLERSFESSRLNPDKKTAGTGDITVAVERLDDVMLAESLPVPDLIKIDVEGADLEVLSGMETLVAAHHPAFII